MRHTFLALAEAPRHDLAHGWQLASAASGSVASPADPAFENLIWSPPASLGTAAAMLRAAGQWNLGTPRRFDGEDWWYRLRFEPAFPIPARHEAILGLDGLASVADVWLNGQHLLHSENMFLAQAATVALLPGSNELVLQFHSLDTLLRRKMPRPRWRAPLVENQQLRWYRTTLLGRLPGWSPPVAPVGPWRPIWVQDRAQVLLSECAVQTRLEGGTGVVQVSCQPQPGAPPLDFTLRVTRGGRSHQIRLAPPSDRDGGAFTGRLDIPDAELWWPHTHGTPALYDACLEISRDAGRPLPAATIELDRIGFRQIRLDLEGGNFAVQVNGVRVFCRGACWTPPDIVTLQTDPAAANAALAQVVEAGMNMVRVGGTMVYESDAFLDACDAAGILLWQDLMFANMDYPEGQAGFDGQVTQECRQLLKRLQGRPCLAVLCGNSEAEQQAAMWGAPRERWTHRLFHELLPQLVADLAPGTPYWPSSAHGGAFPHQSNTGTTSYYGVGAYLRPLTDARHAGVRFATECLGLANVPEPESMAELAAAGAGLVHSPQWKARVPRDLGAGWDFDDIRDHYFKLLFGCDPLQVRYGAHERYLECSRIVSAEVLGSALREWRRGSSSCNGALIWFLRDLWQGAGWGLIDASGRPKAPWYALKRLLQPVAVLLNDEGVNGLSANLVNERPEALVATLEVELVHSHGGQCTRQRRPVQLPPHGCSEIPVVSMLEGFADLTYAYRFGPCAYEAIRARLLDDQEQPLAEDFSFPLGHNPFTQAELELAARARQIAGGDVVVEVSSARLARFVTLEMPGFQAGDQYFHLSPGSSRRVRMHRLDTQAAVGGRVSAFNSVTPRRIVLDDGAAANP